MTVVVTGSCGHVGVNLVRALLAEGRRVRALIYKNAKPLEGLEVERVEGDVLDPATLTRAFRGADVVYHLAARISVDGDRDGMVEKTNIVGTTNVVAACLEHKVRRLVHFSSIHALEPMPLDVPLDEKRPWPTPERAFAYERSKAGGEKAVGDGISRGLDAVIVNPSSIVGPFDYKPSHQGEFLLLVCRRRLPALVPGGYDWVDVRDVVRGAMAAEKKGRTGERYLLSGHWATLADMARIVEETAGIPAPKMIVPMWLARIGAPFSSLHARLTGRRPIYTSESLQIVMKANRNSVHAKATRELDHQPRPLKETVADTIAWFRQVGMLN